ncbi:testis-specific serine/threonine-protein kinase 4 isoform X2 [Physeter macrocephalus]|uniref:non-specific serine/threonine protein kinase n=1 Tax=Physeter macrocephalus TaxID=9755 RepID=A0A9W2WG39_PHYMC|nr:testis-specific serine/threonine-protein kinase 4 isoform X2 [Physeter catodon]
MKVLRHKYLINFYQAIETTSRVYIILELVQGGDVLEWIQHYGACSEPLAGKWFSQMTLGIAYLHSKGIVHRLSAAGRDLKLENLLLDKRENVKISDFGFAKMMPSSQSVRSSPSYRQGNCSSHLSQTYCGSFAYACPEVLLGLPYNPFLSDTWSMGVILYTLVVARLPFDDTNLKKLLRETQKEVQLLIVWHNAGQLSRDLSLPCPRTWSSRHYAKQPSVPPSWTSSRIPGCSSSSLSNPPMRSGCLRPCASPPAPIVTNPWKSVPENGGRRRGLKEEQSRRILG